MTIRRQFLKSLRLNFSMLGYPLDDMSDDEIEQAVHVLHNAVRGLGLTAEEAASALRKALRK